MAQKDKNKQIIYDTAKRLIIEEGYNIGSRQIAREAGVSQALLTYHFSSKKNIAIQMAKEITQLHWRYIKYTVEPDKDPLMYVVNFTNLALRSRANDYRIARFISDFMKEDVLEQSIYEGNQQHIYTKLAENIKNGYSLEKNLQMATGTLFAVQRALQFKINDNSGITYEDYFTYYVNLLLFVFNFDSDAKHAEKIIKESNEKIDSLIKQYPHLINADYFLSGVE